MPCADVFMGEGKANSCWWYSKAAEGCGCSAQWQQEPQQLGSSRFMRGSAAQSARQAVTASAAHMLSGRWFWQSLWCAAAASHSSTLPAAACNRVMGLASVCVPAALSEAALQCACSC